LMWIGGGGGGTQTIVVPWVPVNMKKYSSLLIIDHTFGLALHGMSNTIATQKVRRKKEMNKGCLNKFCFVLLTALRKKAKEAGVGGYLLRSKIVLGPPFFFRNTPCTESSILSYIGYIFRKKKMKLLRERERESSGDRERERPKSV